MLLNFSQLIGKYRLKISGIVQVGAHHGEEIAEYTRHGIKNIVLIEPCAPAFKILQNKFGAHHHIQLYNVACGSYNGEAEMHVETANKGQSNSLLKPKNHTTQYPDIKFSGSEKVRVKTLDSLELPMHKYNMLNMDCQCSEMQVLIGAKKTLESIDYIISEVNFPGAELYEGCTDIKEMDEFLKGYGFYRPEDPKWIGGTWGDTLWIKK